LFHSGSEGIFRVTGFGWPYFLFDFCFESAILEDLAIDDAAAMLMATVRADDFNSVVEFVVQPDQEVTFTF
jgi:hypothetical protein